MDRCVQQYITVNTILIYTMRNDDWSTHTSFPKISGRLVNLRGLSIGDANDICRLMTYNISKSLWEVPYPYSIEHAQNFINSSRRDFELLKAIYFAILYKSNPDCDSSLVGIISLKNIDLDNKNANLGYWIGELYWGNGIASESVALVILVINHAFSVLGLDEVYAYVYSENKASMRVLEKNGMTKKGEANEYSKKLGRYQNTIKFVIKRQ